MSEEGSQKCVQSVEFLFLAYSEWRSMCSSHLKPGEKISKEAMQAAVKRSTLVVAALSDGFFTSDWCAAEIVAAKQAGIKVIPVFSGNDHAANQVDKWVKAYKDHPEFGYVFRENARDVLNKQNPGSVKATLEFLASLLG